MYFGLAYEVGHIVIVIHISNLSFQANKYLLFNYYIMGKVKVSTHKCTKEESSSHLKKIWEDKVILTLHLWDRKIGVEVEKKWDENKAAEYLVDWLMGWCMSTLFELSKSLMDEDDKELQAKVLMRFVEQLKDIAEDVFGVDSESRTKTFNKLFRKFFDDED